MKVKYLPKEKKFEIIEAHLPELRALKARLERYEENWMYNPAVKRGFSDGKIHPIKNDKFALGLWREAVTAMKESENKLSIINRVDFPIDNNIDYEVIEEFCKEFFKNHTYIDRKTGEKKSFFPYDHQIKAAAGVLKFKFCTAEAATGGGKSLIISIIFFYILSRINPDAKFLIIVPSITLVRQFYDEINIFNESAYKENEHPLDLRIEEIMGDKEKPKKVTDSRGANIYISTYQSLKDITKFGRKFYLQFYAVACDEAHGAKASSYKKILSRTLINADYQFGVSGTFQDDDSAEYITIQEYTGPKVASIGAKELQDKKILANVKIYQYILDHGDEEFERIRRAVTGTEGYRLEGDFVRNSKRRIDLIGKLLTMVDKNTLILFNIIEYGQKMFDYLTEYLDKRGLSDKYRFHMINGSVSGKKREDIKSELELPDDKINILFATFGTLSTGVSINNLHNLIFAEGFKKEQRIIQSIGRILRLHELKDVAKVFDLVDILNIDTYKKYKNSLYKAGLERETQYIKHQYPFIIKHIYIG